MIPHPVEYRADAGVFRLTAATKLVTQSRQPAVVAVGHYLRERITSATGFTLRPTSSPPSVPVAAGTRPAGYTATSIVIAIHDTTDAQLGTEGYVLTINPRTITVTANSPAGLFYGIQTLLLSMPAGIDATRVVHHDAWALDCVRIRDYPRFAWRGLMLDVSRHWFSKAEVLAYIDQMVRFKFNVLHLHLTDDQGWRLAIDAYPELTDIGAWRVPRTGSWWSFAPPQPGEAADYGGFYSAADSREIVQYAAERFVTVVPEIDIPGHSLAALAAHPQLSCTGGPFAVNPGSKFYNQIANVLCAGNDDVFEFIDKVFGEVARLFPGPYIHMGGDEATKKFWNACPRCQARLHQEGLATAEQLQSYFVKRVERIIEAHGKRLIGWDEILEGGLSPNATVMSWRGTKGGIAAAAAGHAVIMSPSPYYYLDLYQGEPTAEPETYGINRLRACYEFEPLPAGVDAGLVLGGQGNLWTESVPDYRHAQYMTWPRALAIAESLWSPAAAKNWPNFVTRVERQFERFDYADVKYARSMYDAYCEARHDARGELTVELKTEIDGLDIHYTWAGTNPDQFYPRYYQPLSVPPGAGELRAITFRHGRPVGRQIRVPLTELVRRAEQP